MAKLFSGVGGVGAPELALGRLPDPENLKTIENHEKHQNFVKKLNEKAFLAIFR